MKKIVGLFLALMLVVSLTSCQAKEKKFQGTAKGFSSDITVEVTFDDAKKITDIKVISSKESADIGEVALPKMVEKVVGANSTNVDVVTTATVTCVAFIDAVNAAIKAAGLNPADYQSVVKQDVKKTAETKDVDVVVIGAGGAGMVAAIEAATAGKKVLIVEKAPLVGGNTSRATGGMNAANTVYQKEAKIEDTVQLFIDDTMKGGKNINDPELVKTMAEQSSAAIDWLASIGAVLKDVGKAGGASVNRAHRPVNAEGKILSVGSYLVPIFEENCKKLGVEILLETPASKIIVQDGKAVGVMASSAAVDYTINAKNVIITTGGFGGNLEMVAKLKPELKGYVTTNAPTITGDGIVMAQEVGAATVDMEMIQIHPTVVQANGALITESLRGDGAILVNVEGKRFIDETLTRDVVSAGVIAQKESVAWLIVDGKMFEDSTVIQGYVKKGYMVEGATLADLAKAMSVDAATLETTMKTWVDSVKAGKDAEFNRPDLDKAKYDLSVAPYYAVKIAPGVHHTMGGIKINKSTQVLNEKGEVIPGLFAAGEVTGGVHGANRLGGNAVSDIVVFGRIAGKEAAK